MNIPSGHQVLMPYIIVDGVADFIDFLQKVFGAELTYKGTNPDGSIGHCELKIGGQTIMCSNTTEKFRVRNTDLFIYVENADKSFEIAKSAGGTVMMELADQGYGRSGGITDPFGNIWWITSMPAW